MKKIFLQVFSLLFFLGLFVQNCLAAVGVTEFSTDIASSTDGSSYAQTAGGPANNAILLTFACASDTTSAGSMSGGGLTWNKITDFAYNTNHRFYAFWAWTTATAPGSVAPTLSVAGDDATGAFMATYEITGANVTNPIKQFKTGTATSTNPTITMDAAFVATNGAFAAVCGPYASNAFSAITGSSAWNEIADRGYSTPSNGGGAGYLVGDTGTTVTFTNASSSAHGKMGVEVCEASACLIGSELGLTGVGG